MVMVKLLYCFAVGLQCVHLLSMTECWQVHSLGVLSFTSWIILPSMSNDCYVALIAMIFSVKKQVDGCYVCHWDARDTAVMPGSEIYVYPPTLTGPNLLAELNCGSVAFCCVSQSNRIYLNMAEQALANQIMFMLISKSATLKKKMPDQTP